MVGNYVELYQNHSEANNVNNGINKNGINNSQNQKKPFKRSPLPIDRCKKHIVEVLSDLKKTAIFIGETASGKSTQIPQFCDGIGMSKDGLIAITQPRRVAARSLAHRVACEMGTEVGQVVGYKYRFESKMSKSTRIVYQTEGTLLREALYSPHLRDYSVIIVDEVHERTINTDILLYMLRQAQKDRRRAREKPLRLILMSATMDARKLSEYFGKATIYYIQGRMHTVKLLHAEDLNAKENDYLFNAIASVLQLHETEPTDHGFLVFLTGQEEIEMAIKVISKQRKTDKQHYENLVPLPLYAAISQQQQQQVFASVSEGYRKVVFATNIAETSITIPGIRVIIDSGKVKRRTFSAKNRMDMLQVENISKAQAIQRAGRAGRDAPGKCFRLYSQQDYADFDEIQLPELLRSNISTVLLSLIELGMSRLQRLTKLLDPPDPGHVQLAVEELLLLKAIQLDKDGESELIVSITDEGTQLLKFPVEPSHARILQAAAEFDCLEEGCTIVAFMTAESVFVHSSQDILCKLEDGKYGQDHVVYEGGVSHVKFHTSDGDHVRFLKLYQAYNAVKSMKDGNCDGFFETNQISKLRIETVCQIRKQIFAICKEQKLKIRSLGANTDHQPLRQAICKGLFQNACVWDSASQSYRLERNREVIVRIHPSSCMLNKRMQAFVFTELMQTNEVYARDICPIQLEWIKENNAETQPSVCLMRRDLLDRIRHIQMVSSSPCSSVSSSSSTSTTRRKKEANKKEEKGRNAEQVKPKQPSKTNENVQRRRQQQQPEDQPTTAMSKSNNGEEVEEEESGVSNSVSATLKRLQKEQAKKAGNEGKKIELEAKKPVPVERKLVIYSPSGSSDNGDDSN